MIVCCDCVCLFACFLFLLFWFSVLCLCRLLVALSFLSVVNEFLLVVRLLALLFFLCCEFVCVCLLFDCVGAFVC